MLRRNFAKIEIESKLLRGGGDGFEVKYLSQTLQLTKTNLHQIEFLRFLSAVGFTSVEQTAFLRGQSIHFFKNTVSKFREFRPFN